jgi:predicted amidophosphoribosyltransferase
MTKYMKYRNKLIEQGLCPQCRQPKDRDGYYCSECLRKHNKRRKKDYEFFVENGLCRICGKEKHLPGATYCENCSQRAYVYNRIRYERDPEYVREHNRQSSKKRYDECKALGICTRCKKRKAEYGKVKCRVCLDRDAQMHRRGRYSDGL